MQFSKKNATLFLVDILFAQKYITSAKVNRKQSLVPFIYLFIYFKSDSKNRRFQLFHNPQRTGFKWWLFKGTCLISSKDFENFN